MDTPLPRPVTSGLRPGGHRPIEGSEAPHEHPATSSLRLVLFSFVQVLQDWSQVKRKNGCVRHILRRFGVLGAEFSVNTPAKILHRLVDSQEVFSTVVGTKAMGVDVV